VANIYPWNRQAGTLGNPGLADLPVRLNENSVQAMISNNNQVYVIAGSRGNIYKTDGTNYTKIKRLPFAQNRPYAVDVRVFPNAVFINNENNLLVGVSEGRGLAGQTDLGVYEVAEKEGYPTVKKYSSPTTPVNIGVVYGDSSDNVYVSWANTSLSGVDYTIGNANASQLASFESPIHLVGDVLRKKTYEHISFQLARPFEDQQAINLYYRIVPTDSYTLIGTFDSDSIGTALSHEVTSGIPEAELLQIKCELVQNDFALTVPRPNLGLLNLHIW
jgi:hypothetical protein